MKGKKTTNKAMVSSVTVLVSLLLVNWAVVQARQVLSNSDMDGCEGGDDLLTGWTGTSICGPIGSRLPCSDDPFGSVTGAPQPDPNNCAALWFPGSSAYSQTLDLTSGSEAPGLYAFEAFFGCPDFDGGGTCTFSLTIDSQLIPLTGTTSKNAVFPDTYTAITATGISITNAAAVVSINCVVIGGAECYITRATLTQQGGVIGDPHFVGLDGQIFDLQGASGSAYSILSDIDLQVNCLLGRQQVGPHSFISGPVMMIIAVLTPSHTILANAGGHFKNDTGFVSVDGVKVGEGEKIVTEDGVSVSFEKISASAKSFGLDSDSHIAATSHIEIEGSYRFTVYFVENHFNPHKPEQDSGSLYFRRYLDFSAVLLDDSRAPHGILGQTHLKGEEKKRSIKDWEMEGTENDYRLKDGVLGSDFAFNKFRF